VAPSKEVIPIIEKVKTQKGIQLEHQTVDGANHFFENKTDELMAVVDTYLDKRLDPKKSSRSKNCKA